MLWSPNYGAEYPFTDKFGNVSTSYPTRISNPAEFAALDTNGNGILDKGDDPYLPYYPGDDLVDWVGLSLYHYPDAYTNTLPKPNQVLNSIHGSDGPSRPLHNFYDRFAQMRQKPFIFSETGAPISPFAHNSGPGELLIKQTWWKQVSSLVKSHGLYKGFVNFEERKSEDIETNEIKDWKVITSSNQSVVSAFREDFKEYDAYTLFANEMSIKCNGAVTLLE